MNRLAVSLLAALAFVVVTACSPSGSPGGSVAVSEAWSMATPEGANVGAGYMRISNGTAAPVRLIGGATPVAETVEVHMMSMDGGVMKMRRMDEGLEVPPGGEVDLKPGGFHLMLIGLKRPLAEGEVVPLTLMFQDSTTIDVQLAVKAAGGGHGH